MFNWCETRLSHVPLAFQCNLCISEGVENRDGEDGSEISRGEERDWRLPGLLYADDLVLCGKLEEDMKVMVGCLVEVYKRKCPKVNADKSKMMVLNGEEGLECEVCINGMRLDHLLEFEYLGFVFG